MLANKVKRLRALSPAIDAATGAYSYVITDFEKTSRTGAKDIGAHEYTGATTVTVGPLEQQHVGPNAIEYLYTYNYSSVLPIRLIDFTANMQNKVVQIEWKVAQEINVRSYEVEWSTDGRNFKPFKNVAATGSSLYTATHPNIMQVEHIID